MLPEAAWLSLLPACVQCKTWKTFHKELRLYLYSCNRFPLYVEQTVSEGMSPTIKAATASNDTASARKVSRGSGPLGLSRPLEVLQGNYVHEKRRQKRSYTVVGQCQIGRYRVWIALQLKARREAIMSREIDRISLNELGFEQWNGIWQATFPAVWYVK